MLCGIGTRPESFSEAGKTGIFMGRERKTRRGLVPPLLSQKAHGSRQIQLPYQSAVLAPHSSLHLVGGHISLVPTWSLVLDREGFGGHVVGDYRPL